MVCSMFFVCKRTVVWHCNANNSGIPRWLQRGLDSDKTVVRKNKWQCDLKSKLINMMWKIQEKMFSLQIRITQNRAFSTDNCSVDFQPSRILKYVELGGSSFQESKKTNMCISLSLFDSWTLSPAKMNLFKAIG